MGDTNNVSLAEVSGQVSIGGVHIKNIYETQSDVQAKQYDIPQLQEGLQQFYTLMEAWYQPISGLNTSLHLLEDYYVELHLEGIHRSGKNVTQPTIPIEEVFSSVGKQSRRPTRILIKGDAGYGKSTFCKKLIYDWVNYSTGYMSPFLIVIIIRLRDVHCTIEEEVIKLCNKATGLNYEQEQLMKSLQELGRKVLLVLDGYDEISASGKFSLANIIEYGSANESFLKLATILMTTRKSEKSDSMFENEIITDIYQSFEKILNIDHLTHGARFALIEKYFKNDTKKANTLKEIVRNTEMTLTRSPLLLHIMCYIHDQGYEVNATEDFWEQYLRLVFKRAMTREGSMDLQEPDIQTLVLKLGEMFFKHLKQNEIYIELQEIQEVFMQHADMVMSCGVLGKVLSLTSNDSNLFEPVHKTLMEFLSIKYIKDGFSQADISGNGLDFLENLRANPNGRYLTCILSRSSFSLEIPIRYLFCIQFMIEHVASSSIQESQVNIIPFSKSRSLTEKNYYSVKIHIHNNDNGLVQFIRNSISALYSLSEEDKYQTMMSELIGGFNCLEIYVYDECSSSLCEGLKAHPKLDTFGYVYLSCFHLDDYSQNECKIEQISSVLLSNSNVEVTVDVNHELRQDQLAEFLLNDHTRSLKLSYVINDIHKKFLKVKQNQLKLKKLPQRALHVTRHKGTQQRVDWKIMNFAFCRFYIMCQDGITFTSIPQKVRSRNACIIA